MPLSLSILRPSGARLDWLTESRVVATPALFIVDLMCAQLLTVSCLNFPEPRRSASLKMIKIAATVPWYYHVTPAFPKILGFPLALECGNNVLGSYL